MKRTEMARSTKPMARGSGFARKVPDTAAKPTKGTRTRKCKNKDCRKPFTPDPGQLFVEWCSPDCGVVIALQRVAIRKAKELRAERAADKKKINACKSIPTLKAEAQVIFNRYIRLRDEGLPCICCGKNPVGQEALTGGAWDAGHYRSRGSADHLRYNENNVHRQLKNCNTFEATNYRGGLVARIGLAAVEELESDQTIVKWTVEILEGIKATYAAKIRDLRK